MRRIGLVAAVVTLLGLLSVARSNALRPGEFFWDPELAPSGPLVVLVSLPEQTLSAYRNGIRIAYSSISSGTKGRSTPTGVFTILEKQVTHFSNKYNNAPMPHMQRLTWQGIALHGGDLPGYPASHGCIRLPREFAKRLYSVTQRGDTVIVLDDKTVPSIAARPGILFVRDGDFSASEREEFEWNPERSTDGPVTVFASGTDRMLYVYRNGVPIGHAVLHIENPDEPLGDHAFTMLDGFTGVQSEFARNRPGRRWLAVKTGGDVTLSDLGRRVRVAPEFAEKLYDIAVPGTTVVVTDAPALPQRDRARGILLIDEARQ